MFVEKELAVFLNGNIFAAKNKPSFLRRYAQITFIENGIDSDVFKSCLGQKILQFFGRINCHSAHCRFAPFHVFFVKTIKSIANKECSAGFQNSVNIQKGRFDFSPKIYGVKSGNYIKFAVFKRN